MNKIYRLVRNRQTNLLQVVSKLIDSYSGGSLKVVKKSAMEKLGKNQFQSSALAASLLLLSLTASEAYAATEFTDTSLSADLTTSGNDSYIGSIGTSPGDSGHAAIITNGWNLENRARATVRGGNGASGDVSNTGGIGGDGISGSVAAGGGNSIIINNYRVTGGSGGDGYSNPSGSGTTGGNGGVGVSGSHLILTNNGGGSIVGGRGAGGSADINGGAGGAGVSISTSIIVNDGTIVGGSGGDGGSGASGGMGGAGISGSSFTLINTGSIFGGVGGDGVNTGVGGTGVNVLAGGGIGDASVIANSGTIDTVLNSGVINSSVYGVSNSGLIQSLINGAGGMITSDYYAIGNNDSGVINSIVNFGTIASNFGGSGAMANTGLITTLTNVGSIQGLIQNSYTGVIGTINNLQGQIKGPLTLDGNVPNNYNIIINSKTSYGQFVISGASGGPMTFGIYAGGVTDVAASTLAANTYLDVLEGVDASFLATSSLNGVYGLYTYSLVPETVGGSIWDLVATVTSTNMLTGGTYYLSGVVDGSVNPVFAGGTLALLNNDNSSQNFFVTAPGGIVTSPTGGLATLSGVFSGPGAMTFNGTGTTYMNGISTYTGGTTVASGTLSVGSSEANSTARLAGDVTVAYVATLAGHGGIVGNVTNGGTVAPGGSIGTLSVGGNYVQSTSGTLSTAITPTTNSVLAVTGTASIAGNFSINASPGTYTKRTYTVLTSSGLSGVFSGISGNLAAYTTLGSYLSYDANNAYLNLVATTTDTQQSLVNTLSVLQGIYTLQNTVLANSFSYDCNLFGANNICISAGGRSTSIQAEGINNNSALLIAAYRPHPNYRIGAFADQNYSTNSPGGTVMLGNNSPVLGLFTAWNQRLDGAGAEVKISAGYGQKNVSITRSVVGTSDPGSGSSNLTTQGAQVQAKYGYALLDNIIVSPYIGLRYTQSNMGGYTESANPNVTAPLSYQALNTNATTVIAGVGFAHKPISVVTLFGSVGVESDTNSSNSSYIARSPYIGGLTPINFNANPVKTRPTATLGAYYDLEKNQRVGVTGVYRQEAFQAVSTTTVMATYTVGL